MSEKKVIAVAGATCARGGAASVATLKRVRAGRGCACDVRPTHMW